MSDTMAETVTVSVDKVSIARLHGFACWDCGAVTRRLEPCETVSVAGTGRVWTVFRCAECREPVTS
ncbi:hypothetical protein [Streptomyces sp. NBC_00649]|uniref:hypothetical protein n=1 Tax=Streptomyces sp. NBC_00649 TaxID=2975798 RepID=UPI003251C3D7